MIRFNLNGTVVGSMLIAFALCPVKTACVPLYGSSYVDAYSMVDPVNYPPNPSEAATSISSPSLPISVNETATVQGETMYSSAFQNGNSDVGFDAGNFTASASASIGADGSLHARTSIAGTIAPNLHIISDGLATRSDSLIISGGQTPDHVVFHLSIHGTGEGLSGGNDWTGSLGTDAAAAGALTLVIAKWNPLSGEDNPTFGSSYNPDPLKSAGDGSVQTANISVPWNLYASSDTEMLFTLSLVAYGRVRVGADGATVNLISDFSQTAKLDTVQIFDVAGNDITASENIQFASQRSVPESGSSLSLLFLALCGMAGAPRRRF